MGTFEPQGTAVGQPARRDQGIVRTNARCPAFRAGCMPGFQGEVVESAAAMNLSGMRNPAAQPVWIRGRTCVDPRPVQGLIRDCGSMPYPNTLGGTGGRRFWVPVQDSFPNPVCDTGRWLRHAATGTSTAGSIYSPRPANPSTGIPGRSPHPRQHAGGITWRFPEHAASNLFVLRLATAAKAFSGTGFFPVTS